MIHSLPSFIVARAAYPATAKLVFISPDSFIDLVSVSMTFGSRIDLEALYILHACSSSLVVSGRLEALYILHTCSSSLVVSGRPLVAQRFGRLFKDHRALLPPEVEALVLLLLLSRFCGNSDGAHVSLVLVIGWSGSQASHKNLGECG